MKQKKGVIKLLINFILCGIPLYLLIAYTLFFPMNYMTVEYSMWAEEKDYTLHGESADTLILGDSRAKSGIIPALLSNQKDARINGSVYNMAVGGTTPLEMYYALNRYLANHEAPKNAILIFAPYHFCDMDNWNQTQYYNYLSVSELIEVYKNAALYNDPTALSTNWFTDFISYKLRLPNKYMAAIYNAGIWKRLPDNKQKYESVRADKGYTEFGTDSYNDGANYETHHEIFDYSPLVIQYYDMLLTLCEEHEINVYIEQSPVNQASYDLITPEFFSGYHQMLSELSAKHPDATIVYDVVPYDNKYFGDNNHLNRAGAEIFTEEINQKYFVTIH